MIDPVSAIAMATTAFNTVKKMVEVGREIEDVAGQLGKWYGAAADLSRAEQQLKNPPLFKKLFNGGSIEEQALQIIIHQKKMKEQEQQLQFLLDIRFGYGTWKEMIQLRRKIAREREETIYRRMERRQSLIDLMLITLGVVVISCVVLGGAYLYAVNNTAY